jgi:hypothetical protein
MYQLSCVQAIAQSGFKVDGTSPLQRYAKAAFQASEDAVMLCSTIN